MPDAVCYIKTTASAAAAALEAASSAVSGPGQARDYPRWGAGGIAGGIAGGPAGAAPPGGGASGGGAAALTGLSSRPTRPSNWLKMLSKSPRVTFLGAFWIKRRVDARALM